jgi:Ankyrin repeats (many copies)/Ankyrin repeat
MSGLSSAREIIAMTDLDEIASHDVWPTWGGSIASARVDETAMIVSRTSDTELMKLIRAIVDCDAEAVARLLAQSASLARACFETGASRATAKPHFLAEVGRYIYAGDTALHIAAARYRTDFVERLISAGADVRARNRRDAVPLHAAAAGMPGSPKWDPHAQATTISCLIAAGADPNAPDHGGATPLHKAVRTRCAAAVKALLDGGADPGRRTKRGSTALRLAQVNSGRGGSGSPEARAQQQEILRLLEAGTS